jgi:hypothetical protein
MPQPERAVGVPRQPVAPYSSLATALDTDRARRTMPQPESAVEAPRQPAVGRPRPAICWDSNQTPRTKPKPESALGVPLQPPVRPQRTLIIGADLGLCTKVVWQDLKTNKFDVFRWQRSGKGLPSLLLPSTITLRDRTLHFGLPAQDEQEGDVRIQFLKTFASQASFSSDDSGAPDGVLGVPGLGEGIPAGSARCAFLAYVFHEVESRLAAQFQGEDLVLIWNIGCPMPNLGIPNADWEKLVGVALEIRGGITKSMDANLITNANRLIESFCVPPPSERNYFIQPEGLACREGISRISSQRAKAASAHA